MVLESRCRPSSCLSAEASLQAVSVCWAPDFTLSNSVPKILECSLRLAWQVLLARPHTKQNPALITRYLWKERELSGSLVSPEC